jgi:hypothetical protein
MRYTILVFSRNDLKMIFIGTLTGVLLQLICAMYLKDHPEFVEKQNSTTSKPVIKDPKRKLRLFYFRHGGGALFELVGAKVVINLAAIVSFVAQNVALTGLFKTFFLYALKKFHQWPVVGSYGRLCLTRI